MEMAGDGAISDSEVKAKLNLYDESQKQ